MDKEGRGTMIREFCQFSLPAVWFRIPFGAGFSDKYHVSLLSLLGHCFDVVSFGKALIGTYHSNASLDSGKNEYLVRQRWQFV